MLNSLSSTSWLKNTDMADSDRTKTLVKPIQSNCYMINQNNFVIQLQYHHEHVYVYKIY